MSNDQPPTGPPPDDDPFRKKPPEEPPSTPPPPSGGGPYGEGGTGGPGGPAEPGQPGGPTPPGPGSPYGGSPYGDSPYGGGPYGTPPPPYSGGAADPLAGMPPLAPTGKRVAARIIDGLIVGIPLGLIGWLIGMFDSYNSDDWDEVSTMSDGKSLIWQLVTMVVYIGYDTYLTAKDGQTIGKRLMNLRVAMLNNGMVPEMNASLLRAVILWVPALICCFCLWWLINLVMILVDKPYRQGLHDKAAKTVVVSTT
ncbi:RDD family protein [Streptomyces sp. ISL-96]|uniref:RDD family protein n=1 Tax=Streptomyces sp. ISL-96 TaxID=2819191 RepID=UPI001BE60853|nr:RDD family protein [Streptomyces sp. ISL-96]MBT2491252.1 RDD family protein [Streptomyces sp. ISL-96]